MTKEELVKALERFEDGAEIEIVVNQYNKTYPVAYVGISDKTDYPIVESPHYRGPDQPRDIRIKIDLPRYMRTSVLKKEVNK